MAVGMTPSEQRRARLQAWETKHFGGRGAQVRAARACNVDVQTYRNWLKGRAEVPKPVEELTRRVDRDATLGWRLLVEGLAAQLYAEKGGPHHWAVVNDRYKRLWRSAAKGCLRRGIRTGFSGKRVTPGTVARDVVQAGPDEGKDMVEWQGRLWTKADLAKEAGMSRQALWARLARWNGDVEKVMTTPVKTRKGVA